MAPALAAIITKAASKQTYYTVRFLVDRTQVDDAYRAYAYFRWVDDVLDADDNQPLERQAFLGRQKCLLEACLGGAAPRDVNSNELMLVELLTRIDRKNASGIEAYLRNMMRVMEFDVERRGKLVRQAELNEYTRWLAIAVTEAMNYFIGNGRAPRDDISYLAASAAHIMHMLRDTYDDVAVGYYNVPRELLDAHGIRPEDVQSEPYRAWVQSRVQLARAYFDAGKAYLGRVQNVRYRLAGFAYMARFEWLIDTLEREHFRLRPQYSERSSFGTTWRMGWLTLSETINSYEDLIGTGDWRGHRWHLRGDAPR